MTRSMKEEFQSVVGLGDERQKTRITRRSVVMRSNRAKGIIYYSTEQL